MQITHERLSTLVIYRINSDYDSQPRENSLQLHLQSTYGSPLGIRTRTPVKIMDFNGAIYEIRTHINCLLLLQHLSSWFLVSSNFP